MKSKASSILKQIMAVLSSIAKAKSMAAAAAGVKSKTGQLLKGRLTVVSLLMKNKKAALLGPISDKIRSLMPHHHHHQQQEVENNNADEIANRAIVLYDRRNAGGADCWSPSLSQQQRWFRPPPLPWHGFGDGDDDDKYPDLTHTLFDEEDYSSYLEEELEGCLGDDGKGSVIDMVKSSKALHEGEEFKLEDEIDHVANLFIMRFHKQMRLQKLESFKRNQEMLARGL